MSLVHSDIGEKKGCSLSHMEQKWFSQGPGWVHYSWLYKAFLSKSSSEWLFTDGLKHPGVPSMKKDMLGWAPGPRTKEKVIVPKNEGGKSAPAVWSHSRLKSFCDKSQGRTTSPPVAEEGGKQNDKSFVEWVKQSKAGTTTGSNAAMRKRNHKNGENHTGSSEEMLS